MNLFLAPAKCLTLVLLGPWTVCCAGSPWTQGGVRVVGRSTNDREADLIDALIHADRFDDAEAICKTRLRSAEPESDGFAKWTIRQSQ